MSNQTEDDAQAVADLERVLIHLARAAQRMAYVDDYLENRGIKPRGIWERISEAQCAVEEMLENQTLDDAAKATACK